MAANIATALAKVRPSIATQRKKGHKPHDTSKAALTHGKRIEKTILEKF